MENFDDYIIKFKQLNLKQKQKVIADELKVLTTFTNKMCQEIGAENEILLNKEQVDLKKEDYTEDDFAEALLVYICSIKNSICAFSDKLTEIDSKL